MGVKINEAFKPLYTSDKRYFLVTGGRGSLKTTSVQDFSARLTYERGHGILYTRYTMASAELSIIPEFRITLQRLGIEDDFHITRQTITNKRTGSFIFFSGIKSGSKDHTGRLKSIAGITTWIIEEGEDFNDEKTFDTIDDSIRTTLHQNRVIWIQNPTTKEHFVYKRFVEPDSKKIKIRNFDVTVSNLDFVEHIHTTYHIADELHYLSKDWLHKANNAIKAVHDKIKIVKQSWTKSTEELSFEIHKIWHTSYYYYNYIGGWLERAEGVIFDNWIEGQFDTSIPHCYGLDYGYSPDPLALVKVAVDNKAKKIYLKQIIYETHLDDIPARLRLEEIGPKELIVCDTNEARTTKSIRRAKFNIHKATKTQATKNISGITQDIRAIKNYQLVVDPSSRDIKTELNNYTWDDKKASIPIDDYNHAMDALRYAFVRLTKSKRKGVRSRN